MKKAIALLLLFAMLLPLIACGGTGTTATLTAPEGTPASLLDTYPELCTKSVKELIEDPNYGLELLQDVVVRTMLAYYYQNPNVQYNMESHALVIGGRTVGGGYRNLTWAPEMAGPDTRLFNQCSGYAYDSYYNCFNTKADGTGEAFETYGGKDWWNGAGEGKTYMEKIDDPDTVIVKYWDNGNEEDKQAALKETKEKIQAGDIIVAHMHIMVYLGDCFGNGTMYAAHCWPFNGGNNNSETGAQIFEPEGGIVVEPFDLLCYGEGRNTKNFPTYVLGKTKGAENWAIVRPLLNDKMADYYVTGAAATRFARANMGLYKTVENGVFHAAVPNSDITITETIANHSIDNKQPKDYENITLTEAIPEGTKFVSCSAGGVQKNGVITWNLTVPAGQQATVTYTFNVGKKNIGDEIVIPSGYLDSLPTRTCSLKVGYGSLSEANQAKLSETAQKFLDGEFKDVDMVNEFYREAYGVELNLPKTMSELLDLMTYEQKFFGIGLNVLNARDENNAYVHDMIWPRGYIGQRAVNDPDDLWHDALIRQHEIREELCEPGDVFVTVGGTRSEPENVEIDIVLENHTVLRYTEEGASIEKFLESAGLLLRQSVIFSLRPSRTVEALSK